MDVAEIGSRRVKSQAPDMLGNVLRQQLVEDSKDFKTSWIQLGQKLYAVWKDHLHVSWGYEKFEYYTEREIGLKKQLAVKLLKTYYFLEQEEPVYLREDFCTDREAKKVPDCDAVNVLRLAKQKKELTNDDYIKLRKAVFEKGKDAGLVRQDLTALIKERKEIDPEEERDDRNKAAIRRLIASIKSFQKDMESLKLLPNEIIEKSDELKKELETQL